MNKRKRKREGRFLLRRSAVRYRVSNQGFDESFALSRKIDLLPSTAEEYFGQVSPVHGWSSYAKTLLEGTRSQVSTPKDKHSNASSNEVQQLTSPLALLRNHETTLIRKIAHEYLPNPWASHVRLTIPAALVGQCNDKLRFVFVNSRARPARTRRDRPKMELACTTSRSMKDDIKTKDGFVAFSKCGEVEFPEHKGRNINMMPFVFGDRNSLPEDLQCYHGLIEQCPYMKDEVGKIGYLTIEETHVEEGQTQRRKGLHIEAPGSFSMEDSKQIAFTPGPEHRWGNGVILGPDRYEGGIFMASSVGNTCEVWDALVDKTVPGIVDSHGGCDHLRNLIGPGTKLGAGELIWMTDCTPHEALPQEASGPRQFFRVVTPYISHWFADHSTPNPKVPIPSHVTVVYGNKFESIPKII